MNDKQVPQTDILEIIRVLREDLQQGRQREMENDEFKKGWIEGMEWAISNFEVNFS